MLYLETITVDLTALESVFHG